MTPPPARDLSPVVLQQGLYRQIMNRKIILRLKRGESPGKAADLHKGFGKQFLSRAQSDIGRRDPPITAQGGIADSGKISMVFVGETT